MDFRHATGAGAAFEPSLSVSFLPRCEGCYAPHPLAAGVHSEKCPQCGARVAQPGAPIEVEPLITGWGPSALSARAFLAIGRALRNLARKVTP